MKESNKSNLFILAAASVTLLRSLILHCCDQILKGSLTIVLSLLPLRYQIR